MNTVAPGFALAGGLVLAALLRLAWRAADGRRSAWILLGWLAAAAAVAATAATVGSAPGVFLASVLISVAALGWVATGLKVRDARTKAPREVALEPSDRASRAWRGWLRTLLAGPIGGVAAIGVGVAVSVWAPGAAQTRMVIGGILVPLLWAGAMAWTLSDDRILRATAVLTGVTVLTFGASALKGFA